MNLLTSIMYQKSLISHLVSIVFNLFNIVINLNSVA